MAPALSTIVPLSVSQEAYLLLDALGRRRGEAQMPFVVWLGLLFDNPPQVAALRRALQSVAERHAVLRASFCLREASGTVDTASASGNVGWHDFERPYGVVHDGVEVGVRVIDVVSPCEFNEETGTVFNRTILEEIEHPFDYSEPPLMRAVVFRLGRYRHLLSVTFHHLISDRWSLNVVRRDLAHLYSAFTRGEEPHGTCAQTSESSYFEFATWQRRTLTDSGVSYWIGEWSEFLPNVATFSSMPSGRSPDGQPLAFECARLKLPPDMSCEIRDFARSRNVTAYVFWLSAMLIALSVRQESERIAVWSYLANRPLLQWQPTVGWFANTFLCGVRIDHDGPAEDVLKRVRQKVIAAIAHQAVPFGAVWRRAIDTGLITKAFRAPGWVTFDHRRVMRRCDALGEPWRELAFTDVVGRRSRPELAIALVEDGIDGTLTARYPTNCFSQTGVQQLLNDIAHVATAVARAPLERVGALPRFR